MSESHTHTETNKQTQRDSLSAEIYPMKQMFAHVGPLYLREKTKRPMKEAVRARNANQFATITAGLAILQRLAISEFSRDWLESGSNSNSNTNSTTKESVFPGHSVRPFAFATTHPTIPSGTTTNPEES
eukprot:694485-Rhodomonas_salina.1